MIQCQVKQSPHHYLLLDMWFSVCSVTWLNVWGKNEPCQMLIARDNPNCWSIISYTINSSNQMWCKCFQSRLYELQNRERISLAAASKLLSNMAMLMPLSNTLIVVMIFRAWVSPWCDDRWVWQEGTRAMFYAFKYCVTLSCLYAFNYINCFILVAEGPYFFKIIRLKFRFLLTRLTGF